MLAAQTAGIPYLNQIMLIISTPGKVMLFHPPPLGADKLGKTSQLWVKLWITREKLWITRLTCGKLFPFAFSNTPIYGG
jgi:hypothetical protein